MLNFLSEHIKHGRFKKIEMSKKEWKHGDIWTACNFIYLISSDMKRCDVRVQSYDLVDHLRNNVERF